MIIDELGKETRLKCAINFMYGPDNKNCKDCNNKQYCYSVVEQYT